MDPSRRRVARATMIRVTGLVGVLVLAAGCGGKGGPAAPSTTVSPATTSPVTTSPVTTSPPTTAAPTTTSTAPAGDAIAQITAAFVAFFDGASGDVDAKVKLLQNGEQYREMLTDAAQDPQFKKMTTQVRSVRLLSAEECSAKGVTSPCALVNHDLLVGGFPALVAHDSFAVQVEGKWLVASQAWCDVVAIGGASCP